MIKSIIFLVFLSQISLAQNTIQIFSETGSALAGAKVLIGPAVDVPFVGNYLVANAQGAINVPKTWKSKLPVTIQAAGHIRSTFFGQDQSRERYTLNQVDIMPAFEFNGITTGFGSLKMDGLVDFSMVFPAVHIKDIFSLNLLDFVSTDVDKMKVPVVGEASLPSNISIPTQYERYIVKIKLSKPGYRLKVQRPGVHRLAAIHAQIPLKKLIKAQQKKLPFYQILNLAKFSGAGVRDLPISKKKKTYSWNLPVGEISYNQSFKVHAPVYDSNKVMISASLFSHAELLFPTDIKAINAGENLSLAVPENFDGLVLSTLLDKEEFKGKKVAISKGISLHMDRAKAGFKPSFLNPSSIPSFTGRTLSLNRPLGDKTVAQSGTYISLAKITKFTREDITYEFKERQWEFHTESWKSKLEVPIWPSDQAPIKDRRWDVLFFGSNSKVLNSKFLNEKNEPSGRERLNFVTHAVLQSIDI